MFDRGSQLQLHFQKIFLSSLNVLYINCSFSLKVLYLYEVTSLRKDEIRVYGMFCTVKDIV